MQMQLNYFFVSTPMESCGNIKTEWISTTHREDQETKRVNKKKKQKIKNKLKTKWPSVPLQTNTDVTETTAQYICYLRICSFVKHITTFLCTKVHVVLI